MVLGVFRPIGLFYVGIPGLRFLIASAKVSLYLHCASAAQALSAQALYLLHRHCLRCTDAFIMTFNETGLCYTVLCAAALSFSLLRAQATLLPHLARKIVFNKLFKGGGALALCTLCPLILLALLQ